jgi:putative endonuclease
MLKKAMSETDKKAYVYILCNDRRNVLYIGCTEDLKKRIYMHKKRLIAGFTKKYNVHRLVYFKQYSNITKARESENYLKGKNRAKKIALIKSINSTWNDLSSELPVE